LRLATRLKVPQPGTTQLPPNLLCRGRSSDVLRKKDCMALDDVTQVDAYLEVQIEG
jgi:hypothetical protein